MDKVSEQLVGAQITAGFDRRVYEYSSAYRKAHSCETTLINLDEEWRLARDNKLDGHVKGFRLFASATAAQ